MPTQKNKPIKTLTLKERHDLWKEIMDAINHNRLHKKSK